MPDSHSLPAALRVLERDLDLYKPPPKLTLIEWSDRFRKVASKTSAAPGRWKTATQPCAFGPMLAATDPLTHTVTVMAGTQILKSESLINVASYYICQDPSPILLVQPTQGAATAFSKERFAPTIEATPALRDKVIPLAYRDSENTIGHKDYAGGSIDFVGANSPTDLSSRPKRIILCDEIDKWPTSAGEEGDPLKLAEERASTYHNVGRAKFVRTCSPTVEGFSRIGREYAASDQRKCYVLCPHCAHDQVLTWAHVRWDRDEQNNHLPDTAAICCEECGAIWSERDRLRALDVLAAASDYGWRQTKPFACCGETHTPSIWDDRGRSLCPSCGQPSPYQGHAGFHCSKLYSKRHRLSEIVKEFLEAKADQELLRKWTNTALAELWAPQYMASFDSHALMARAENYGPLDLPEAVLVITGFCDVQGDRLEVMFVGWGRDMEAWVIAYEIIHQDPAEPQAWKELDALIASTFRTVSGRPMRVAAFGIDVGGGVFTNQVLTYCKQRRGRRVFACKGTSGASRPIWPGRASESHHGEKFFATGVDSAKDSIAAALRILPPAEPGLPKPGFIHFASGGNMGPEFYDQLDSERRQLRKRIGQTYLVWVKIRERNEVWDCLVGCLVMRKSLPNQITAGLDYSVTRPEQPAAAAPEPGRPQQSPPGQSPSPALPAGPAQGGVYQPEHVYHQAYADRNRSSYAGWINPRRRGGWMDRDDY
jgi:phage terminase large subunit GpA-like protein